MPTRLLCFSISVVWLSVCGNLLYLSVSYSTRNRDLVTREGNLEATSAEPLSDQITFGKECAIDCLIITYTLSLRMMSYAEQLGGAERKRSGNGIAIARVSTTGAMT